MLRPHWMIFILAFSCALPEQEASNGKLVPSPIFEDPHYHGSCDPEIVWNDFEKEWWIFYTARRAKRSSATYVGTPIGVAASKDLCSWRFVGYCSFDEFEGNPDMPVTFLAPGIIRKGNDYHMFVTFKNNADPPWGGPGSIVHYKAPGDNLLNGWRKVNTGGLAADDVIDATLIRADDEFRIYYRMGRGNIHLAVSKYLDSWEPKGKCTGDINATAETRGFDYQEAPFVFFWHDKYWLLTDPHKGLAVYVSSNGQNWQLQGRIMAEPGTREHDNAIARHASVAIIDNRAFLFYHVEPWRPYPSPGAEKRTIRQKLSFLQTAELKIEEGRITCDRNAAVVAPTNPIPDMSP